MASYTSQANYEGDQFASVTKGLGRSHHNSPHRSQFWCIDKFPSIPNRNFLNLDNCLVIFFPNSFLNYIIKSSFLVEKKSGKIPENQKPAHFFQGLPWNVPPSLHLGGDGFGNLIDTPELKQMIFFPHDHPRNRGKKP